MNGSPSPKPRGLDVEMAKASSPSLAAAVGPAERRRNGGPGFFLPLFMFAVSCAILAAIIFIALLTIRAEMQSEQRSNLSKVLKLTVSETLTLVSIAQGLLAVSVTVVLIRALHYLQWGLSARKSGISYLEFLALSPTTLDWGSFLLIFASASHWSARTWSGMRVILFTLVWISGMVLFSRTTLVTAFDTALTYDVTAGIGPFNSSYVSGFMETIKSTAPDYPYNILPYSYYGMINNLILNPMISTVMDTTTCINDTDCASYLLSGGVWEAAPWMPPDHPEYPLVRLNNVPAIQVDFRGKHGPKDFKESDCQLLGSAEDLIGAELCIREEGIGEIYAGIYICTEGVLDGECITTTPAPHLTTTATFHRRQTNLLVSKTNYTITSVTDLTPAEAAPIDDIQAYKQVLGWLLDYNASHIPAPSSIIESFWTSSEQMNNPSTDVLLLQNFRSILAFPVWMFNANNYGNSELRIKEISPNLPEEFYTQASFVQPYLKLKFNPIVLTVFVVSHIVVLGFSAVALIWAMCHAKKLPTISSFPVFDVYFKPQVRIKNAMDNFDMWHAEDSEIIGLMKNASVGRRVITPWSPNEWI